jgi:hypothetical protein
MSPIKTRSSALAGVSTCNPSQDSCLSNRDDDPHDESYPNTPSRPQSRFPGESTSSSLPAMSEASQRSRSEADLGDIVLNNVFEA